MFQKVTNAENARLTAPPSVRSDCHAKRPAARSDDFATYIAMVWLMTGSFSVRENCAAHDKAPHASCQDHARSERAERSGKLRYWISAITVGSPSQHPLVRLRPEGSNLGRAQTHYFRDRASSCTAAIGGTVQSCLQEQIFVWADVRVGSFSTGTSPAAGLAMSAMPPKADAKSEHLHLLRWAFVG
jgi:hypothetical protein